MTNPEWTKLKRVGKDFDYAFSNDELSDIYETVGNLTVDINKTLDELNKLSDDLNKEYTALNDKLKEIADWDSDEAIATENTLFDISRKISALDKHIYYLTDLANLLND